MSHHLNKWETDRVKTATEIEHTEKELAEKQVALVADEKQWDGALLSLKIEVSEDEPEKKIRQEIAGVQAQIAEITGIVALVEEKGRQEKSAQTALEKIRKTFDESGKALQAAGHNLETAGRDHERLSKDCALLAEETERARTAALADVESFGISRISLDSLDALWQDLIGRKDAWQAKEAGKAHQEKQINELKAGIETHQALLRSLEEDLSARRQDRDGLKGEYEFLSASRREQFGEKNTDHEEKRLAGEVDKVGRVLENAREDYGKIEKEISALKDKIHSLQGKTDHRTEERWDRGGTNGQKTIKTRKGPKPFFLNYIIITGAWDRNRTGTAARTEGF